MKNETEDIRRKCLHHDNKSSYLECSLLGLSLNEAERILSGWHSFESPDIYTKYNKTVYGLEHFKYDVRKRNKNESQQRRDEIKIKQSAYEKIRKKIKTEDSVTIHEEIMLNALKRGDRWLHTNYPIILKGGGDDSMISRNNLVGDPSMRATIGIGHEVSGIRAQIVAYLSKLRGYYVREGL